MTHAAPAFLALGDSYTIGEAVAQDGRWPVQLVARLRQSGTSLGEPQIIAVTGWSTDELAQGMATSVLTPPYALVSLLIGVNNQYRGRDLTNYRAEFSALLDDAIRLAGGRADRVVVLSIPDWGVTRFAAEQGRDREQIAAELDAYNATACAEVSRTGAHWVDVTGISRQHPELVADDGLHPSAEQYTLWTEAALPVVRDALSR